MSPMAGITQDLEEIQAMPPGGAASRNEFLPSEKLLLARLCVVHGKDYSLRGGRERFWTKIQQLFSEGIGRTATNPRTTMMRMTADFTAKINREVKETGTAQTDGEYEQTMAQWKAHVDSVCFLSLISNFSINHNFKSNYY